MNIIKLEHPQLSKQDKTILISTIYNNFVELADEPKLMHTPDNIKRILDSKDALLLVALDLGKIVGYVLAEIMYLEDGRKVVFVSYIYVAEKYRNKYLGTELMGRIFDFGTQNFCDGVMLIYDSTNRQLRKFYEKLGFMLDFNLRRYEKHDVFYKVLY